MAFKTLQFDCFVSVSDRKEFIQFNLVLHSEVFFFVHYVINWESQ